MTADRRRLTELQSVGGQQSPVGLGVEYAYR